MIYRLNHFLAAVGVAVLATLASLPWPLLAVVLVGVVLLPEASALWRGEQE